MKEPDAEHRDVRQTVREFILKELLPEEDPSHLSDTTHLISGGILDSISLIRLVTHLEHVFEITLEQRVVTVKHMDTIESITRLVAEKLGIEST